VLYEWSNSTNNFVSQSFSNVACTDYGFFTANSNNYLIEASTVASPRIFRFNSGNWVVDGSFSWGSGSTPSPLGYDWAVFTIGSTLMLAYGSAQGTAHYVWALNGNTFNPIFSDSNSTQDWEFYTIGANNYLVQATDQKSNCTVFSVTTTTLTLVDVFSTNSAYDTEYFQVGSTSYLAIAENGGNTSHVRQWNGSNWIFTSYISVSNALNFKVFTFQGSTWLSTTGTGSPGSALWKWNSNLQVFDLVCNIGYSNPRSTLYFHNTIDGNDYLHFAIPSTSYFYKLNLDLY